MNKCIYCCKIGDLSKSDIFPDALTNSKIINPNVCKEEHNSKFSDMFEYEVIKKLSFITNELDIKSSKSKRYAKYEANITIGDITYKTHLSSDSQLFSKSKKMKSLDGTSLLGNIDEIREIKTANESNINEVDVNNIEIEKNVNIEMGIFFSNEIYRLAAKIAFEWYCLRNRVTEKFDEFIPIINFIVKNNGENIVSIVSNREVYDIFKQNLYFGSHALIAYVGKDKSVNVLVNFFGIMIYNVRVLDRVSDKFCYNILFEELRLNSEKSNFSYKDKSELLDISSNDIDEVHLPNIENLTIVIPKNTKKFNVQNELMYLQLFNYDNRDLQLISECNDDFFELLLNRVKELLNTGIVTLTSLKRFAKEYVSNKGGVVKLNPKGTQSEVILYFYILYKLGKLDNIPENIISWVNKLLLEFSFNETFAGKEVIINEECCKLLNGEMLSDKEYSKLINRGANLILG